MLLQDLWRESYLDINPIEGCVHACDAYLDILTEDGREAAVKTAVDLQTAFPGEEFDDLVMSENFQKVMKGFEDFIKDNTTNKTFHFWRT